MSFFIFCILATFSGCSDNIKRSYSSDEESLVETIEQTHPSFSLNVVSSRYNDAKDTFLNDTKNDMTRNEFVRAVRKYMASLEDAHSVVQKQTYSMFIDISWQAADDKLYLLYKDGKIMDKEVISIGGVSVSEIFKIIDEYFAIENDTAKERNYTLWSRSKDILLIAGCNVNNNKVSIGFSSGASQETYNIKSLNIYGFYDYTSEVSSKMIGNVFYIDYNTCNLDNKLIAVINQLKLALSNGTKNVISDTRDNGGGDSEANKALLSAMGMTAPDYGIYLRYSLLLSKQWNTDQSSGDTEYLRDMSIVQKNPDVNLVVLTNANTFSFATMLAVTVQDGKLGMIIGQSSSNAPNCYGDILIYTMPDSKIEVSISCKRFLRPDPNANQQSLIPDIVAENNDVTLQVAVDFLSK